MVAIAFYSFCRVLKRESVVKAGKAAMPLVISFFVILAAAAALAEAQATCQTTDFNCGNGKCISKSWLCDGEDDCGNERDEMGCENESKPVQTSTTTSSTTAASACGDVQFDCGNGRCVPSNWVCDGDNDCSNNRDEANCPSTTTTASTTTPGRTTLGRTTDGRTTEGRTTEGRTPESFVPTTQPTTTQSAYYRAQELCYHLFPEATSNASIPGNCNIMCTGNNAAYGYEGRYEFKVNEKDETPCYTIYDKSGRAYYRNTPMYCLNSICTDENDLRKCQDAVDDEIKTVEMKNECALHCIDKNNELRVIFQNESVTCYENDKNGGFYGYCQRGTCIKSLVDAPVAE